MIFFGLVLKSEQVSGRDSAHSALSAFCLNRHRSQLHGKDPRSVGWSNFVRVQVGDAAGGGRTLGRETRFVATRTLLTFFALVSLSLQSQGCLLGRQL